MAVQVDAIQFNAIPKELAFDPVWGPLIRDLYTKIWQIRNRVGGDNDDISDLVLRMNVAESDIDSAETDITALQAADVSFDARADALEAFDITLSGQIEALELQDISMLLLAEIASLKRRIKDLEDGNS